jgi:hypothetical protein
MANRVPPLTDHVPSLTIYLNAARSQYVLDQCEYEYRQYKNELTTDDFWKTRLRELCCQADLEYNEFMEWGWYFFKKRITTFS